MVEPGIEPGTSWLVFRSSDHQTTRLVNDEDEEDLKTLDKKLTTSGQRKKGIDKDYNGSQGPNWSA